MPQAASASPASPARGSILVVDDTAANLTLLSRMLGERGYRVRPVPSGRLALKAAASDPPDLILLDISMPEMDGFEVCRQLKEDPRLRDIPVIFISALTETEGKVKAFRRGGVDYVTKPFQIEEVEARVETHLRLRNAQAELARYNRYLEQLVEEKVKEISESQLATIFAMVKLAESRDDETGTHIWRVREYCLALANQLRDKADFAPVLTDPFVRDLYNAAPLHDIGKVGIPDSILLKPERHTPEEFEVMKTHTTIGARTLQGVGENYPRNSFITMGAQVAHSHHERWDGSGYPRGLAGDAIPLAAQIMSVADVYDALRTARRYKPAFDHAASVKIMTVGDGRTNPSHFDPRILSVFAGMAAEFDSIYDRLKG
ncbi:MAG: two-component system response regulator [Spirochaetia bacterium]